MTKSNGYWIKKCRNEDGGSSWYVFNAEGQPVDDFVTKDEALNELLNIKIEAAMDATGGAA